VGRQKKISSRISSTRCGAGGDMAGGAGPPVGMGGGRGSAPIVFGGASASSRDVRISCAACEARWCVPRPPSGGQAADVGDWAVTSYLTARRT
jgi:hypothetical protein